MESPEILPQCRVIVAGCNREVILIYAGQGVRGLDRLPIIWSANRCDEAAARVSRRADRVWPESGSQWSPPGAK